MPPAGREAIDFAVRLFEALGADRVTIERRDSSVALSASGDDGFGATLYDEGDTAMVAAERWHAHYDDPYEAAFCAMWLFTPYYRVVHELRNGVLAAVWIERWEAEGWVAMEPVYYLNPDHAADWEVGEGVLFSRRYAQQDTVRPPKPYAEFSPGVELDADGRPPGFRQGVWLEAVESPLAPSLADGEAPRARPG